MDAVKELFPVDLVRYSLMPWENAARIVRSEVAPIVSEKSYVWLATVGVAAGMSVVVTFYGVRGYFKKRKAYQKIDVNRERVKKRMDELKSRLKSDDVRVNAQRKTILKLDIDELSRQLKANELTPTEVLEAYQARAFEVHDRTNSVCDFILEASNWARELEEVPVDKRGPLFGIPISVKEAFQVKDYDATLGLTRYLDIPAEADGPIIAHFKYLGALPFCLTNVPQTLKSYACGNPIYGATKNPVDPERSPGGSSGGEGALIAAGGSIVGLGTDVGGSVRTPALFCGCVGMKPTTGRIYQSGRRVAAVGKLLLVQSNAGLMSSTTAGSVLVFKALLSEVERMTKEDHEVVPLPWNEKLYKPERKLKIGWYTHDGGWINPSPGIIRGVKEAARLLSLRGHEVVPFDLPNLSAFYELYFQHMLADGGSSVMPLLDGEPIDISIAANVASWAMPNWFKTLFYGIIGNLLSPATKFGAMGNYKTSDLWLSAKRQNDLTAKIMKEWVSMDIDVVIGPGFPFFAPPIDYPTAFLAAIPCVGAFNCMDLPVGTVPVTNESGEDQAQLEHYQMSPHFDLLSAQLKRGLRGGEGLPIGVQVIGKRWQEEMVMHAMQELEKSRDENGKFDKNIDF